MNKKLLSNARTVLDDWLVGETKGGEYVAINPLRNDSSTGSFSINLTTGVWKDFAVEGFAGPDLVSLYMALHDLDESAALDALEAYLSKSGLNNLSAARKHIAKPEKTEVKSAPAPADCHMPPEQPCCP